MTEETKTEKQSMDILKIMSMVPHRYPFLLIDRITEYEPGKYVKGYKNVTMNENFFMGHFPENPIMPGVLQIEALAQISAGMVMTLPEYKGKLALFAGIDKARFKRIVRPGDRLDMEATVLKAKGPIIKAGVRASVDGVTAVEAELLVAIN
ncbi:MAG: 3-hydroxyacyl-ACP dehydratase FabZ [Candidatus Gastranaerophilales bacterium]|nr:3-hydroxyacyl-ACP dehydratase FabZ [Candidatus Gastranaerophilales bacterium]